MPFKDNLLTYTDGIEDIYLVALILRCMGQGCERTVFRIFLCSLIKWFTSRQFDNLCDESWKPRIEYWAAERLQRTYTNGYHHVSACECLPCQLQVSLPCHKVRLAEAWNHTKTLPSYVHVLFVRLKLITVVICKEIQHTLSHTPTYTWSRDTIQLAFFAYLSPGFRSRRARWYNIAPVLAQWLHWKQTHWPSLEKALLGCLLDYHGDLVSENVCFVLI